MLKIFLVLFIVINLIWIGSQNSYTKRLIAGFQTQVEPVSSATPFPSSEIPIYIPTPSPTFPHQ
jgi:hypothetical protein